MNFSNPVTAKDEIIIPKHLGYIDALRATAAIYVCLHHVTKNYHSYLTQNSNLVLKSIFFTFSFGHLAVDLFIVLSGFCLMLPAIRHQNKLPKGAINFFVRRATRILPTYYFSIVFCVLLIVTLIGKKTGFGWDDSIPVTPRDIFLHLFLIHDLFGSANTINYVGWSIAVEFRIYLIFPTLLLLWRRIGAFPTLSLTFVFSVILVQIFKAFNLDISYSCPHYLGLFSLGMLAAAISFPTSPALMSLQKSISWRILTFILATISLSFGAKFRSLDLLPYVDFLIGICAASLLITIASSKGNLSSGILGWKPLVFVGSFSYSLYLIHAPLQQVILQYFLVPLNLSPVENMLLLGVPGTIFIIGCAYLFFLVFEKPFLTKKRS